MVFLFYFSRGKQSEQQLSCRRTIITSADVIAGMDMVMIGEWKTTIFMPGSSFSLGFNPIT